MIEELINLVKEHAGDAIIRNPVIPDEQNETAIRLSSEGIGANLKSLMTGGNASQLAALFNNKDGTVANPMIGNMVQSVAGNLMQRFGISAAQAGSIAGSLIPQVVNSLVRRTNDPGDNTFSMDGILSSLSGGNSGISNMPGSIFGDDKK